MFAAPLSTMYAHAKAKGLPETGDPTLDIVHYLAMIYGAVEDLERKGINIELNGQPLILPSLERAYREVIHIRSRVNEDWLNDKEYSRYGRLYSQERHAKNLPRSSKRRTNRNTGRKNKSK